MLIFLNLITVLWLYMLLFYNTEIFRHEEAQCLQLAFK